MLWAIIKIDTFVDMLSIITNKYVIHISYIGLYAYYDY